MGNRNWWGLESNVFSKRLSVPLKTKPKACVGTQWAVSGLGSASCDPWSIFPVLRLFHHYLCCGPKDPKVCRYNWLLIKPKATALLIGAISGLPSDAGGLLKLLLASASPHVFWWKKQICVNLMAYTATKFEDLRRHTDGLSFPKLMVCMIPEGSNKLTRVSLLIWPIQREIKPGQPRDQKCPK